MANVLSGGDYKGLQLFSQGKVICYSSREGLFCPPEYWKQVFRYTYRLIEGGNHMLRIAMISYHTCPLATLGGKDTGGMNVYVRESDASDWCHGHPCRCVHTLTG